MTLRPSLPLAGLLGLALATPALAADWSGGYIGGHAGRATQDDARSAQFLFDTDLDGRYGDTVNTAAPANAFSPGFCGGAANAATPAAGCRSNSDDRADDFGLRLGWDWQRGDVVYGLVGEYANGGVTDSVSAFSTTPAFYTIERELGSTWALRGRLGLAFGADDANLFYGTAGYARASVDNRFSTSNGVNTFTQRGGGHADGAQYGLGYERRLGERMSLGLEYLVNDLRQDDFVVRAQGPAPATNPFILVNADGTDMRRSDRDIRTDSLRLTLNFRF